MIWLLYNNKSDAVLDQARVSYNLGLPTETGSKWSNIVYIESLNKWGFQKPDLDIMDGVNNFDNELEFDNKWFPEIPD